MFQKDSEVKVGLKANSMHDQEKMLKNFQVSAVPFNQFVSDRMKVAGRVQGQAEHRYRGGWVERESEITGPAYFNEEYKGN